MRASPSTLLRYVRSSPSVVHPPPNAVGIDDWAFRRGHRYGTIVVDLQRHEVIDLLEDREAEGYSKRIAALQEEIIEYLREHPAETPLSVRLSGPSMAKGVVKATLASQLITGLQSALYHVEHLLDPRRAEDEARTEGLRSILTLNLVATAPGSFVLALDLAPRQLLLFEEYDIASSAVERLIQHVNELQEAPSVYTGDRITLRRLRKVADLVKRDVEAIEIIYREEQHRAEARFDPVVRERIEYLLGAPEEHEMTVRGTLVEINIENNSCKVHPPNEPIVDCNYEEDLEDDLIAALKQEIEMAGQFIETGWPGHYRITRIERFRMLSADDADLG